MIRVVLLLAFSLTGCGVNYHLRPKEACSTSGVSPFASNCPPPDSNAQMKTTASENASVTSADAIKPESASLTTQARISRQKPPHKATPQQRKPLSLPSLRPLPDRPNAEI
ncbi:MAG: hypothetical protein ACR650_01850 [Methylocystis sp.]